MNVTDADHELLVRHQLGASQRALLKWLRRGWLLGSIGLTLVVLLTLLFLASLWIPGLLPRELAVLLTATGCVWIWRLREAPHRWLQVGRDLRAGAVYVAEGPVVTSVAWGWGIVRAPRYLVRVDGHTFPVDQETLAHLQPHAPYRVFYAPESGSFLGAVPSDPASTRATQPDLSTSHPHSLDTPAPAAGDPPRAPTAAASGVPTPEALTLRETAILQLIAAGHSNQAIADELSLSVNTVKMYCSGIYQKLGVRRRTEAVAVARQHGLLDD